MNGGMAEEGVREEGMAEEEVEASGHVPTTYGLGGGGSGRGMLKDMFCILGGSQRMKVE